MTWFPHSIAESHKTQQTIDNNNYNHNKPTMRFHLSVVAAAIAAATVVDAFAPIVPSTTSGNAITSTTTNNKNNNRLNDGIVSLGATTDMVVPFFADIVKETGPAGRMLRNSVLTNAQGDKVRLGDAMGTGTSVVVFLRHMG